MTSGILAQFMACAERLQKLASAIEARHAVPPEDPIITPTIKQIVEVVSKHFGVTRFQVVGAQRATPFVKPRHIAMYLAREMTLHSLPAIGKFMGGRDHTTVMHAVRNVTYGLGHDPELGATLDLLKAKIREEAGPRAERGLTGT